MRYKGILSVPNIVLSANFVFEWEILSPFRFLYCRIVLSIPILFLYYPSLPNFSVSHYLLLILRPQPSDTVNCSRPVGVDFILLRISTSLLQARPTLFCRAPVLVSRVPVLFRRAPALVFSRAPVLSLPLHALSPIRAPELLVHLGPDRKSVV